MQTYGQEYFEPLGIEPGLNQLVHNPFKVLDFALLALEAGETYAIQCADREYGFVALTGAADYRVNDQRFGEVGGRRSVFAGGPAMVYAPCQADVHITARSRAEIAVCSSPSASSFEPYYVAPSEGFQGTWGQFNTTRTYHFMLDQRRPSERLHLAEVTVASGNWATYPPHKHEVNAPDHSEIFQEELYFYRVEPAEGFGFCALYGGQAGSDYAFVVRNNTVHKMPFGYHTVCAAPGYRVWYLAVIAGDAKAAQPAPDPNHAWYAKAEIAIDHIRRTLLG